MEQFDLDFERPLTLEELGKLPANELQTEYQKRFKTNPIFRYPGMTVEKRRDAMLTAFGNPEREEREILEGNRSEDWQKLHESRTSK